MDLTVLVVIAIALLITGIAFRPRIWAQVVLGAGVVGLVAAAVLWVVQQA